MSVIQDRLSADINQILKTSNKNTVLNLKATLHTPSNDIQLRWLESVVIYRDYNTSLGDYVIVDFRITADVYKEQIEIFKDNMEITIYGWYGSSGNYSDSDNKWPYEERYKLLIMNQKDTQGDKSDNLSKSDMELTEIKMIRAQCVQREMEMLRTVTTDGIFRNVTAKDYLYWLYTVNNGDYGKISGENVKYDCCIYPPNNEVPIESLIIPSGMKVLEIPAYIQNKGTGIYKGNIGTYMQKMYTVSDNKTESQNIIFVYPLYNKDMFDTVVSPKTKLMVFYPANHLWDSTENNFKEDGDVIKIIPSGKMVTDDDGENKLNDQGAGYITNNPMGVLTRNLDIQSGTAEAEPSSSINAIHVQDKRDGMTYTPFVPNVSNEYVLQSELARNTMCSYVMKWRYCDMNKIYPGMPVNIVRSTTRDDIIEIKGSVQATFCRWDVTSRCFSGVINIFAEKWSLNNPRVAGEWDTANDESNPITGTQSLINKNK